MTTRFEELSKAEQEMTELAYQQMNPEDFDALMAKAKQHVPAALRLPSALVERLQTVAESAGEPEYQVMALRWIEERLQLERAA